MSNGYSRSPKLIKGALVEFSERFLGAIPNIIVFQYNPEAMTRTLTPWRPPGPKLMRWGERQAARQAVSTAEEECKPPCRSQPQDPPEAFQLPLELDAADAIEEPAKHPTAVISGVAERIAALEMLLYPQEGPLLGGLTGSPSSALSACGPKATVTSSSKTDAVSRTTSPVVLFVWGPGRILPVRLRDFQVEEQAYSPLLYPIRAKVTVGLEVLNPQCCFPDPKKDSEKLAAAAYCFTKKQKQLWAAANIANTAESILGDGAYIEGDRGHF
jgi:hypothetical protein